MVKLFIQSNLEIADNSNGKIEEPDPPLQSDSEIREWLINEYKFRKEVKGKLITKITYTNELPGLVETIQEKALKIADNILPDIYCDMPFDASLYNDSIKSQREYKEAVLKFQAQCNEYKDGDSRFVNLIGFAGDVEFHSNQENDIANTKKRASRRFDESDVARYFSSKHNESF